MEKSGVRFFAGESEGGEFGVSLLERDIAAWYQRV